MRELQKKLKVCHFFLLDLGRCVQLLYHGESEVTKFANNMDFLPLFHTTYQVYVSYYMVIKKLTKYAIHLHLEVLVFAWV